MADIFFYTDIDSLTSIPQTATEAYGPISGTQFRVTSIHKASASIVRAIAMCDGIVAVQLNNDDPATLINIILKPTKSFFELSGVNQVPVRYIIYKGINKSSLIITDSGVDVIKNPSNDLTFHLYGIQDKINREKEKIQNPHATIGSIVDKASAKLLKYDISLTSTDDIDKLFYNGNNVYQIPDVRGGWYIGDFNPTKFGVEILLDDIRAVSTYEKVKKTETIVEVLAPTGSSQEEIFRKKTDKEEILFYIDPCAFYGSFHRIFKLKYVLAATVITPGTGTTFLEITSADDLYNTILSKFFNKNRVYVDIRNDFNRSFNYMENYSNFIKLRIGMGNSLVDIDYYNDTTFNQSWPILFINDSSQYSPPTNSGNLNTIELLLPYSSTENKKSLLYISQGYVNDHFPKELKGNTKFIKKTQGKAIGFLKPIVLGVFNVAGSTTTVSSCYIKIKYLKKEEKQPPSLTGISGIVHRNETFFDNIFQPILMKVPINFPAPEKTFVHVYNEQEYISTDINEHFTASIGIALDPHNVTFFAFAQELNKPSASFIPISLLSEASNKEHFISNVNNKYVTQKLLQGSVGGKGYLRFANTDSLFSSSFRNTDPKLNEHFLSIIIKNTTYVDLITNSTILDSYDSYIVLKDKINTLEDPITRKKYTTYKIVLRGYKNTSGTLSLEEYDPNITLYGYSNDNALVLLEDGADTDLYTADEIDVPCSSILSTTDLHILRAFIQLLNSPSSLSFITNLDLSQNVFNETDRFCVTPTTGTPIDIKVPADSYIPSNGFMAEGCYTFAMYKLTEVMNSIKVTDELYIKFKKALVKNGFKEPENNSEHQNYLKLLKSTSFNIGMNVNIGINKWGFVDIEPNNLKNKLYDLMGKGNWDLSGARLFTFPRKVDTYKDELILVSLNNLLVDITSIFYLQLKKEAGCLFNILRAKLSLLTEDPEYDFIATGEGSTTNGILHMSNSLGSILFHYAYIGNSNIDYKFNKKFNSRKKNVKTIVHISIMGLNFSGSYSPPQVNIYINYPISKQEYKCSLTATSLSGEKLEGISNPKVQCLLTSTSYVFKSIAGGIKIATFDKSKNDFIVEKNDEDFEISIELISGEYGEVPNMGTGFIDYDETQLMICLVDGLPVNSKLINLELNDVYKNNQFELRKSEKIDLFFQEGVFDGCTDLVNKLLQPGITFSNIDIILKGRNIGKRKPESEHLYSTSDVVRDLQYDFNLPRAGGRTIERTLEEGDDHLVRYSHGFVFIEDTEIIIVMESFVSPQWARLDEALYNDSTAIQANRIPLINDLDLYTLYGADNAGTISLPTNIGPYVTAPRYDASGLVNLPSYNPILSALRCFGLLDGLRSLIRKRAFDMGKTAFDIDTITQKLDHAINLTFIPQDLTIGVAKPISQIEFNKFKWYTDAVDKTKFGDLIP